MSKAVVTETLILDRAPAGEQATGAYVEREDAASSCARLVFGPADWHTFEMAEQEGTNTAVRDDGDVPVLGCLDNDALYRADDPALGLDRAFLTSHALVRVREEEVGRRLEFRLG